MEGKTTQIAGNTNGKEVFGVRPKKRKIEKSDTLALHTEMSAKALPFKDFTSENLGQLQLHIQQELVKATQKIDESDPVTSSTDNLKCLLLQIIKQALAWWAASFTIQTVLGER